jgi:hypothetical protein
MILLTVVVTFLVTVLCVLFGTILGVKMAQLFNYLPACLIGPLAALAIGLGFGLTHLPFLAGLIAGVIGCAGSAIILARG